MTKQVGLTSEDLETMTVGMCLDYFDTYITQNKQDKKRPAATRKATQADMDRF